MLYKVSYVVGILGYIIMMATFMGFYLFFGVKPHVWMDIGLLMMFYALYYGVLARDVAEICTEKMVSGIGVRKVFGNFLKMKFTTPKLSNNNPLQLLMKILTYASSTINQVACQRVDLMQMFVHYVEINF